MRRGRVCVSLIDKSAITGSFASNVTIASSTIDDNVLAETGGTLGRWIWSIYIGCIKASKAAEEKPETTSVCIVTTSAARVRRSIRLVVVEITSIISDSTAVNGK